MEDPLAEYEPLVRWFQARITVKRYDDTLWRMKHTEVLADFLTHPDSRRLAMFVDGEGRLQLLTANLPPARLPDEFMFFVRGSEEPVTLENVNDTVGYGMLRGNRLESLLRVMNGVFAPQLVGSRNWPESMKRDFVSHLHKFMASLTEVTSQLRGKTVLYVPLEDVLDTEAAARDKDLVQRLQSTVIHWTRQIKEVVTHQDHAHDSETAGPLEEIEFWRRRTLDLSGISEQLNAPGVQSIVRVLECAGSTYLPPFLRLSQLIQDGTEEAKDNMKFLNMLSDPCMQLQRAHPQQIPIILPQILNCARMIWSISRYYNTPARLTGLLRKVSNELINRCRQQISVAAIFDGDVRESMARLEDSIQCGREWHRIYERCARAVARQRQSAPEGAPGGRWDFEETSIFAQVDAFVQRCKDLLEVCEGRLQFTRQTATPRGGAADATLARAALVASRGKPGSTAAFAGMPASADFPLFGGTKGPEITKSLRDIERSFNQLLRSLRGVSYDILDVKATNWHDDYNRFKNGVKDLEKMLQNVINAAFESVTTVRAGVHLLDAFYDLVKSVRVKRWVEKKTADVYQLFVDQVRDAKLHFDTLCDEPPLPHQQPQYAGAALWARGLRERIAADYVLLTSANFLVPREVRVQAQKAQADVCAELDDYVHKKHAEWVASMHLDQEGSLLQTCLDRPLLRRTSADDNQPLLAKLDAAQVEAMLGQQRSALLSCNFDTSLLLLLNELRYWECFDGDLQIPYAAHDIAAQREKLRVAREHVMLVVRDYNHILQALDPVERRLFSEHKRRLDKRINPGLQRLNWSAKGIVERFVTDCRANCQSMAQLVTEFKAMKVKLSELCRSMGATMLFRANRNTVCTVDEFEARQRDHQASVRSRFSVTVEDMLATLRAMYGMFEQDGPQVQREWRRFVLSVDDMLEAALQQAVKRSLQALAKTLNGDVKTEPLPTISVNVVLEQDKRVRFDPPAEDVSQLIMAISNDMVSVTTVIPRLTHKLAEIAAAAAATATASSLAGADGAGLDGTNSTLLEQEHEDAEDGEVGDDDAVAADGAAAGTPSGLGKALLDDKSGRPTLTGAAHVRAERPAAIGAAAAAAGRRGKQGDAEEQASADGSLPSPSSARGTARRRAGRRRGGTEGESDDGGAGSARARGAGKKRSPAARRLGRGQRSTASTGDDMTGGESGSDAADASDREGEDGMLLDTDNALSSRPSFYTVIAGSEETQKLREPIKAGALACVRELHNYSQYWIKYEGLYSLSKDAFFSRFRDANPPLKVYEDDIERYRDQQATIESENVSSTINFVVVSTTHLKAALVRHCVEWQNRFTGLLNDIARAELTTLQRGFEENTLLLRARPDALDSLSRSIDRLQELKGRAPETEKRFEPVEAKYAVLSKFEVHVPERELQQLAALRPAWEAFQGVMEEAEHMLADCKRDMKKNCEDALSAYVTQVADLRKEATAQLPYSRDVEVDGAFEILEQFKARLEGIQRREEALRPGLRIFRIEQSRNEAVASVQSELQLLEAVWELMREWDQRWEAWKRGSFYKLDVMEMEQTAAQFNKRVARLGRDVKGWDAWAALKERVDQFRQTLPLIQNLGNPAMRDRHWAQLKEEMQKEFDHRADDFTLERIAELGLHLHADFIGGLAGNANKELSIEQALQDIEARWREVELDVGPYKDGYFKVRSTEDLFVALEDDQVALSTMKASRFYAAFASPIDAWDAALTNVSETVELTLTVQRQWMYLENIFMSSEDIRKQMPKESAMFDRVNTDFTRAMRAMVETRNAKRACEAAGLREGLRGMDRDLEAIQQSLDEYLETKRQMFPRFYFLSNDDLLEILGHQKDPAQVQKHIKKCFEGIKALLLEQPGKGQRHLTATGMCSPDGEQVPFHTPVTVAGPVELWLINVERSMVDSIRRILGDTIKSRGKKERWIREHPGQLLITTGKVLWTAECGAALMDIVKGNKKAMRRMKKKQVGSLNKLADLVRGNLSYVERQKLVAYITIEIHSRDVIERMIKANCSSPHDFMWLSQLRFYFEPAAAGAQGSSGAADGAGKGPTAASAWADGGECRVRQTNTQLEYGYEYQGNNGRLVVTPLTDRCVLTLTTALHLNRGGNPLGPAGTGKTETVKDLGKNLAKYVVVFNCSDGLDYKSVGRMFSGLVQSGGWGCFDEFNRIEVEVLSVVAQQIQCIMAGISERRESIMFEGAEIKCNKNCGIFVTMNPGYAGRSELPDNLKSMMRPVAMMVPDLAMIAEVMLMAEGFRDGRALAKKTVTLYSLMVQQLSKQDHYDYGLRSLKAVLNCAGALKRAEPHAPEDMIVLRALRDMNVPKFIKEDFRLFLLLLGDLFPGLELPVTDYGPLQAAVASALAHAGLQQSQHIVGKTIQLYESKATRHCNMLVGHTMGGKSTCWRTLAAAKTALAAVGQGGYSRVTTHVLNPKSMTMNELYGFYDLTTMEWTDGVLSAVFRHCAQDSSADEKWLLLDGPVDTLWIESMNTVMDDNKTLTLINGDRIAMSNTMSLLFEVQDLAVASPATVSRAGMVYLDADDLGWRPFVASWLDRKFSPQAAAAPSAGAAAAEGGLDAREHLQGLFDKYVDRLLACKRQSKSCPIPISDFNAVVSLCHTFDVLATPEHGVVVGAEDFVAMSEKWFAYCLLWTVCASADDAGRKRLDECIRDLDSQFPLAHTCFDYYVDVKARDFKLWEERVPSGWKPAKDAPFFSIMVPTVDTVRHSFILDALILQARRNTLVVGGTGTGKTVLVQQRLSKMPETHKSLEVNFSAATTAATTQEVIEGVMEKRGGKDKFGPSGGKRLVTFVDDLNMPRKDTFGSQPALELLRQWIDYGGWYDRAKQTWRHMLDMQVVAAMGPPGGGRNEISARTQSRFHLIHFPFPAQSQVRRIFEAILAPHLADFDDELKHLAPKLVQSSVELYNVVNESFLPTPTKCHYLFNMRDIARIVQGLVRTHAAVFHSADAMIRLWVHESFRVFCDRLTTAEDQARFRQLIDDKLAATFEVRMDTLIHTEPADAAADGAPMFSDLPLPSGAPAPTTAGSDGAAAGAAAEDGPLPVREVKSVAALRSYLEESLEMYNAEPGVVSMGLVLFRDAVGHVCRITRILSQPRGNALLVGVGGSGRQSLTRLAAYVKELNVFSVEITKNYRLPDFRTDLKSLYQQAGVEGKPTVFLFTDTQIKDDAFLEDVNSVLSSGTVPNLFDKDELTAVYDALRPVARARGVVDTAEQLWELMISRVRDNLHIVLAMSPVGDGFRDRCRMYPALVNCTTVDWFHEWPEDALQDVATRFLEDAKLATPELRANIAACFAAVHRGAAQWSERMLAEMQRHYYVTPTNYLELVKGYRELLDEKRREIGHAAQRLKNGLSKLDESREQVESMSVELAEKKRVVAQKQKDCEDLLVDIVSERRVADEQRNQVEAESQRIAKEEVQCKEIADDAETDLNRALPALQEAMMEVDKLDKSSISEVKAYSSPPAAVEMVLSAVMILFGERTDWASAKKKVGEANFLQQIKSYDKDNVSNKVVGKVKAYVSRPEFTFESVAKISRAAATLCVWVRAIYIYASVFREVAPKREALQQARDSLRVMQEALAKSQAELARVNEQLGRLKQRYEESVAEKNKYRSEAEMLEAKLERAGQLVSGLSGERERWEASIAKYEVDLHAAVGDSLLAAGFLSYAGPFDAAYRTGLVASWVERAKRENVPMTEQFDFAGFLARPTDVRDWNIQGLPADAFSTENGVIATRGRRWPLMVDPQGQAVRWVRNMEGTRLKVSDLKARDYLRELENAVQFGAPYLLQDVPEDLDPALDPVLTKSVLRVAGGREIIRIGDRDVDYSRDFRMYLTTKLANPHFPPEVTTKVAVINFAVKEQGLESQLLGIVVQREQPTLEQQKSELVVRVAQGKKKLLQLESEILRLLSESSGSLLDDESVVQTLQASKTTSEEVSEQLQVTEETEARIDEAREAYRPVSLRASTLFFVLDDLGRVDPMYQFDLDAYVELFIGSIEKSRDRGARATASAAAAAAVASAGAAGGAVGSAVAAPATGTELAERIEAIRAYHTFAVYKYACRGLFERHKLLLSFQMCSKMMAQEGKLDELEFGFFLRGGMVVDRTGQRRNPCEEWLSAVAWDNVVELAKLANFQGLAASFEQQGLVWRQWYMSEAPELEAMPGEWDMKTNELQRMCILRSMREDRVTFAVHRFVAGNLGAAFVDPPPFNLREVVDSSNARTPLIFVLSPGVDPHKQVAALARDMGVTLHTCALGQGQAPVATRYIEAGATAGHWVFLANCHLMTSWMPQLEKLIEATMVQGKPHPGFRLWLSSSPSDKFPIAILQRGIKMTTEPPRGLKANMLRLYSLMTEEQFERCEQKSKYRKLLYCLCWFHSVLLERRKFKSLGFNVPYEFNDSDFGICEDILRLYLDEYPEGTPWQALRYLIAEANYGGRVTDDWDRRLVNVYIHQYFSPDAVDQLRFPLSELATYVVPEDGALQHYREVIKALPQTDPPQAFGQHPNADIASQIEDARGLLGTVVGLQPRAASAGGESDEARALRVARDLAERVPDALNMDDVRDALASRSDPGPLQTVLLQEVERYNRLLVAMGRSLRDLERGLQGLVVITPELEGVFHALLVGRVPSSWGFCYPSLKPLGSWMRDLGSRVRQMDEWAQHGMPRVFWLSGFTYPTGFLTALLQTSARQHGVPIDSLSWDFPVLDKDLTAIHAMPKDGAYVQGMLLEGARWDADNGCLDDAAPMQLLAPMPIVHFRPVDGKKRSGKGQYRCPLYLYPVRTGTRERPSFMIPVDLKSGARDANFWTKRGTALLLSSAH